MSVIGKARAAIKGKKMRLVMPEGTDSRISAAAAHLLAEDLAVPLLFTEPLPPPSPDHVAAVFKRRAGMNEGMVLQLLSRPLYRAGAMVATGEAEAMLAGVSHPTARIIEAAMMTIGIAPAITDLAGIAIAAAHSAERLTGEAPRGARLCFSSRGSARHAEAGEVVEGG